MEGNTEKRWGVERAEYRIDPPVARQEREDKVHARMEERERREECGTLYSIGLPPSLFLLHLGYLSILPSPPTILKVSLTRRLSPLPLCYGPAMPVPARTLDAYDGLQYTRPTTGRPTPINVCIDKMLLMIKCLSKPTIRSRQCLLTHVFKVTLPPFPPLNNAGAINLPQ